MAADRRRNAGRRAAPGIMRQASGWLMPCRPCVISTGTTTRHEQVRRSLGLNAQQVDYLVGSNLLTIGAQRLWSGQSEPVRSRPERGSAPRRSAVPASRNQSDLDLGVFNFAPRDGDFFNVERNPQIFWYRLMTLIGHKLSF